MVDAIVLDEKRVLPCTAYLEGEYGIDGLYMGVPVVLGSKGIERIVELDLDDAEQQALKASADAVRDVVSVLDAAVVDSRASSGRTAIVCGASAGLGLGCAESLAGEGANVVMFARRAEALEREAARLGALAVPGDVTTRGRSRAASSQPRVERLRRRRRPRAQRRRPAARPGRST